MGEFLRPRLGVLTTLRAQSGAFRCFVPRDDVLTFETVRAVDLTGTGTLSIRANSPAAAELLARRVIEVVHWASVGVVSRTDEWRILTRRVVASAEGGTDVGIVTCTIGSPILDWPLAGRIQSLTPGDLPTWTFTAIYTPTQAATLLLAHLATRGQGHWELGDVERDDARLLTIEHLDAAQLRELIASTWDLEPVPERVNASTWRIHFRVKRAGDATVPTLRATGALQRVDWTQDAGPLATAILPEGADGATIAHAAWRVTGISGNDVSAVDPGGGPGPIPQDGLLVGTYLQRTNNTLAAVLATARGDGTTSVLTLDDASNIYVGDELEFRADADGTRLVVLTHPGAIATYGYCEATESRTDLTGGRNYTPNPRGASYVGSGPPDHWAVGSVPFLTPNSMGRGTPPVGCPVTDDGTGQMWYVDFTEASGFANTSYLDLPATPALDAPSGDRTISAALVLYIARALTQDTESATYPRLNVVLRDADTLAVLDSLPTQTGNQWVQLTVSGLILTTVRRVLWHLEPADGSAQLWHDLGTTRVWVAIGGVQRGGVALPLPESPDACVLWQAGMGALLSRAQLSDRLSITAADYAVLDPARFGDIPLVVGGDAQLQHPALGLDRRVRLLSLRQNELAPTPPTIDVVATLDPAIAALVGSAAPSRKRDIIDVLRSLTSGTAASSTSGSSTGASAAPAIITSYERWDPRRYGASGADTSDVTDAVQAAADWGTALVLPAGLTFYVRGINIAGHNMPGANNLTPAYRITGGGRLVQVAGAAQSLLYFETCDGVLIDGISLHGNAAAQTSGNYGLYGVNTNYVKMRGVLIRDTAGTGLVIAQGGGSGWLSDEWDVTDCEIIFCGGFGVYVENSGDHTFSGNHVDFNAWDGMSFVGCYTTTLLGNHALSNTQAGVVADGCRGFLIGSGNMLRENQREGLVLKNGAGGHRVQGTRALWNSLAGQDSYDAVLIDTCPNVKVHGCDLNDFYYASAGYPVSNTSRQRYGINAANSPDLHLLGNDLTPNHTGAFNATGTTTGTALGNIGLADGAF